MHGNASCFMGRICINQSLLDTFKDHPEEILAALCHEIGHSKRHHLLKNVIVDIGYMILFRVFLQHLLVNPSYLPAFGFQHESLFVTLALSIKLFQISFDLFLRMGMHYLSRQHEFEADAYACEQGYKAELRSSLIRSFADNSDLIFTSDFDALVNFSHPSMLKRIQAIDDFDQKATQKQFGRSATVYSNCS